MPVPDKCMLHNLFLHTTLSDKVFHSNQRVHSNMLFFSSCVKKNAVGQQLNIFADTNLVLLLFVSYRKIAA